MHEHFIIGGLDFEKKGGSLSFLVLATVMILLFQTLDFFMSLLFFVAHHNLVKF